MSTAISTTPPTSLSRLRQHVIRSNGIGCEHGVPLPLRPLIRAYLLGYTFCVTPRLLTLLVQRVSSGWRGSEHSRKPQTPGHVALRRILCSSLEWHRFPTFCAALVGGSTLLEPILRTAFSRILSGLSPILKIRLSRWFSSFIAAWLSLRLLQSKQGAGFTETKDVKSDLPPGTRTENVHYAGRTLDLSLFAAARALDVVVGELWSRRPARRRATSNVLTKENGALSKLTDPANFAFSCALIMWTWIYLPSRLPRAYNKWIAAAAAVDDRLVEALRRVRTQEIQYGKDTGQAPLLQSMCKEYRWPAAMGDPAKSIPFPCEVVHMGSGPSCEYHALSRFGRAFKWSMSTYLPLQLILLARRPSRKGLIRALFSATQSSAFLSAFITFFYYGVCLARTRIGPYIIGTDAAARQKIDGGICVGTGCFLCGWSILIENASRRKELALFVAPRAMATLLPRRYPLEKQWRETFVFAFSTAIVFTCALENKRRVRGFFGKVLTTVLKA